MSNKTPKKQLDATESAPKEKADPKRSLFVKILFFAFVLVFISINLLILFRFLSTKTLNTPNGTVFIEIVDTPELRKQGLSGRESIGDDAGMLFVFEAESEDNCFWMKDMRFAIDMVWLDAQKRVVSVKESIGPETYPKTFCPDEPSLYGLELQATKAKDLGIETGVYLDF